MNEFTGLPLFEGIPEPEVEWLWQNSSDFHLAEGDFFYRENQETDQFYIVLEGELQVTRTLGNQEIVFGTTPPGVMGGVLALLNRTPSSVSARAIMPTRLRVMDVHKFRQLFFHCPVFGSRVFQTAAERTQLFTTAVKQQEKMAALGKLSAGLAHELNNPNAAARRAAATLHHVLPNLIENTLQLVSLNMSPTDLDQLHQFQQQALERYLTTNPLPPVEQSDREDELTTWLEDKGIENGWELAPGFVAADLHPDELEALLNELPPGSAPQVVTWLNQCLGALGMVAEIEASTQRISDLVAAVKEYTYMDQGSVQEVDIHKGLENTLTMLNHKMKGVTVHREYDPELPLIQGRGSDLNQVWTNLIDNAVDVLGGSGEIRLITRLENNYVMVEITDNGPGIPEDVQPHLFEPFYTTKEVGSGTGLGLDISYRIVTQHNGAIDVQSEPGCTRFIVRLPVETHSVEDRKEEAEG